MKLYIVRGLPSAGKTTLANILVEYFPHLIFEADKYFIVDGKYQYDPEKIGEAHAFCHRNVKYAMEDSFHPIAVANTFTKRWEMDAYYELAKTFGYEVVELTVGTRLSNEELAKRNLHGVPVEVIQKMRERWEV